MDFDLLVLRQAGTSVAFERMDPCDGLLNDSPVLAG